MATSQQVAVAVKAYADALDGLCASCLRPKAGPDDWTSATLGNQDPSLCWGPSSNCLRPPARGLSALELRINAALDAVLTEEK